MEGIKRWVLPVTSSQKGGGEWIVGRVQRFKKSTEGKKGNV